MGERDKKLVRYKMEIKTTLNVVEKRLMHLPHQTS